MNQRAIDLYKEACEFAYQVCQEQGRTGGASDHIWNTLSTGRFAELIVRECIQTLRDNTPVVDEHDSVEDWDRGYIRGMVDCEHHIKEHFGVEQ